MFRMKFDEGLGESGMKYNWSQWELEKK